MGARDRADGQNHGCQGGTSRGRILQYLQAVREIRRRIEAGDEFTGTAAVQPAGLASRAKMTLSRGVAVRRRTSDYRFQLFQ